MNLIKKLISLFCLMFIAAIGLTVTSLNVKAARLDTHTGIIISSGSNVKAYSNSSCTTAANHYLCPADWYNTQTSNSTYVYAKYPITVKLNYGGEDSPTLFSYYFKYSEFHKSADSSVGTFSANFSESTWYNSLPCSITYTDKTDNGATTNGSLCYVSNNYGFYTTSADIYKNKILKCYYNSNKIMYADTVSDKIYYNPTDYIDADWHWARSSQAWSTTNLNQGKNTVYFAGTDASANYTTSSKTFYYDTYKPKCYYSYNSQTKSLTLSATDDTSVGSGNYSGLKNYSYTITKDNVSYASSSSLTTSKTISLSAGTYVVTMQATDNAGNTSTLTVSLVVRSDPTSTLSSTNTYRTDTDVISAINVKNTCDIPIVPSDSYTVTLSIPNVTTQTKELVIPASESNLIWFKWHTPTTPQSINATYTIHTDSGDIVSSATYNIEQLEETTPPNPLGTDTQSTSFQYQSPTNTSTSSRSWTEWTYENNAFQENSYTATLYSTLSVTADTNNPTAYISNSLLNMKSGYGIAENVSTTVATNYADAVTPAQNCLGYYPEFEYESYNRLFDQITDGQFWLKTNEFSMYNSRVHFTPVWWNDSEDYVPLTYTFDAWTPVGMLGSYSTEAVKINGSCFDDWHVYPKK